jgi:enoyl-CoA hydratase/carnithine racemase
VSSPTAGEVIYERHGHVAVICLNRPARANSLSVEVMERLLPQAWRRADEDDAVGAIVLTASGDRFFCAGADLRDPDLIAVAGGGSNRSHAIQPTGRQNGVYKPIVTAVGGACVGGGLMFIGHSDICIASTRATFSNPGISLGIVTSIGPVTLARTASYPWMMRMALLGRHERLNAQQALNAGLVTEVTEPEALRERALQLAGQVAENSPAAAREMVRSIWEGFGLPLHEAETAARSRAAGFGKHPDAAEGIAAASERRAPRWSAYRAENPRPPQSPPPPTRRKGG